VLFRSVLEANSTTNLAEGTNLYFTDTRVYTKVKSSLIAGSNTSITFDDALQTITIASQGNVQSVNGETGAVVLDTDDISEGAANLYYTEGKFDASLATKTTDDLAEGTNEYYTDAKVDAVLVAEDVTKQGNTFNGAEQLVKLDASAKLPAIDGSNLTNLPIPPSTGGNLYLFYNY
jgi:predicted RecA/RadA family phage recombinase